MCPPLMMQMAWAFLTGTALEAVGASGTGTSAEPASWQPGSHDSLVSPQHPVPQSCSSWSRTSRFSRLLTLPVQPAAWPGQALSNLASGP